MLSTSQHEAFAGFSFYGDGWGKPDLTSTPFRTTADQMWSEDMELLPSLSLPEPALAGGRPHLVGGTAGGTGSASSTPPGALAASSAPTTPLAPVRELSDLNLNEMASAAEAEAFSAAARLSMPTPVAPPGLGPVLESSIADAAGGSRALPQGGDRHDRGGGGSMVSVR